MKISSVSKFVIENSVEIFDFDFDVEMSEFSNKFLDFGSLYMAMA